MRKQSKSRQLEDKIQMLQASLETALERITELGKWKEEKMNGGFNNSERRSERDEEARVVKTGSMERDAYEFDGMFHDDAFHNHGLGYVERAHNDDVIGSIGDRERSADNEYENAGAFSTENDNIEECEVEFISPKQKRRRKMESLLAETSQVMDKPANPTPLECQVRRGSRIRVKSVRAQSPNVEPKKRRKNKEPKKKTT